MPLLWLSRLVLVVAFSTLASCSDHWEEDSTWSEATSLTKPNTHLKHHHAPSPLFIENRGSEGVTKLGFSQPKLDNLLETVRRADGDSFVLDNFITPGARPFVLKSYEVFSKNAKLVQQNSDGTETVIPQPNMLHLHGSISGDPSSFVLLHLHSSGSLGMIQTATSKLAIESDPAGHSILVDSAKFKLGGDQEKELFAAEEEGAVPDEIVPPSRVTKLQEAPAGTSSLSQSSTGNKYELGIALDCDQLCVARLNQYAPGSGQGTDATSYLTALIAGTATVYKRDLGRDLKITYLKLWNTASPFDSGTNSLGQYRQYYAGSSAPSQPYDVAHLMTGIQEGGVAYVGTVCRKGYNVGVSSLRGQWKGQTSGSSAYMWDLEVTAHELGHNFGSGHSHDYSPPIDECVSCKAGMTEAQCKSGGSAVGPVARTDARCVQGTVMSYCHLCGGMQNINMNFHPRAIERIKTVLDNNCGTATPPVTTPAPSAAPTPAPTAAPKTVNQKVRIEIEVFDDSSFKNAIAQLLNAAITQGSIAIDASSGFTVTSADISILKAQPTRGSYLETSDKAAARGKATPSMAQVATSTTTDVQYQVTAPSAATDTQISQLMTTLDSSADSDTLTQALVEQCNGQCGAVGASTVVTKAAVSNPDSGSAYKSSMGVLQTLVCTLSVLIVVGGHF